MVRRSPVMKGPLTVPIYAGITAALIVMLLIWDGGSITTPFGAGGQAGVIVGCGAFVSLLTTVFIAPWLYRAIIKDDWQLRWYHIPREPLLLRRPEPPTWPEGFKGGIQDFYEGHLWTSSLLRLLLMCSLIRLPVSTTQCIVGAVVGVGLYPGTWRSINWRMVAWIYGG